MTSNISNIVSGSHAHTKNIHGTHMISDAVTHNHTWKTHTHTHTRNTHVYFKWPQQQHWCDSTTGRVCSQAPATPLQIRWQFSTEQRNSLYQRNVRCIYIYIKVYMYKHIISLYSCIYIIYIYIYICMGGSKVMGPQIQSSSRHGWPWRSL